MSENLRQFTSLDYADADMYGAILNKPTTATPLDLPLENFASKTPSTNPDPLQLALNRQDETRRQALFAQQRNQQTALEQGLREREIARNIALQATQSKPREQPIVSSRDYENRLNTERLPLPTSDRQPAPSTGRPRDAGHGFTVTSISSTGTTRISYFTNGGPGGSYAEKLRNLSVSRVDGYLESTPDIQVAAAPHYNEPYYFANAPLNHDNTIPSGKPAAGLNKGKNRDVVPGIPANNTPNSTAPFFPGHGGLAPSYLPNPTQTPSNLGGMLPAIQPAPPKPLPFAEPEDAPLPRVVPAPERFGLKITPSEGGIVPIIYAEVTPATITQSTITQSEGTDANGNYIEQLSPLKGLPEYNYARIPATKEDQAIASGNPQTAKATPVSDGLSPVAKGITVAVQKTPEQAASQKTNDTIDQQKKDFDQQIKELTAIATILAGLTPIIKGMPDAIANNPNVQAANKATTQAAVCEIAQPGGCVGDALDNSANKINQNNNQNTGNILDKINVGANAAQLALLELINTKLGGLLPGGLSGTFTRLWQTLQVDRILNILVLVTTFHNALMLSNNLAQTLFGAIDNIGQTVGFKWKNEKGEETGFGGIASEWTAGFFKGIFGIENYTSLVSNYKKANRIYQASANILNSIQSVGASILSGLEVIGGWNANIGNALKRFGTVGEKAYAWMNPNVNFQNKYFTALENVTNVVSQIDQVASETLSIKESIGQITEQKKEIDDSLKQNDASKQKPDVPEAVKLAQKENESKAASASLPIVEADKEPDEDN